MRSIEFKSRRLRRNSRRWKHEYANQRMAELYGAHAQYCRCFACARHDPVDPSEASFDVVGPVSKHTRRTP